MKSCPTCSRTFEDTLTFCLVDGAILSPPFDPEATVMIPNARETVPQPMEMGPASSYLSPREAAPIALRPKRLWPRLVLFILLTPIISFTAAGITAAFLYKVFDLGRAAEKAANIVMFVSFVVLLVLIIRWWRRENRST